MSTERMGGASPSNPMRNNTPDTKAQREEKQRVEKVREIDPDEETQQRRRKFQMMMGDEEQATVESPKPPSPYQVEFHLKDSPDSDTESEIPSTLSPSPDSSPVSSEQASTDLPQSDHFWEKSDLPPDLPPQPPTYKEVSSSKKGKQDALHLDPFHGPISAKKQPSSSAKKEEKKPPFFYSDPNKKDDEALTAAPFFSTHKSTGSSPSLEEEDAEELASGPFSAPPSKQGKSEKEKRMSPFGSPGEEIFTPERKKPEEKRKNPESFSLSKENIPLPPIPPDVQPAAQTALTQATPYLSPQTVPLFFQMIGAIYWMISPPGVQRTEFVLNHPAYANSKFFGARITIEKYTSAPDSFNIRLTGSDAAVTAFKENIPSLLNAFQKGNFAFRIHRFEADYSTDRPVFRRKERQTDSDSDMGGDFKDK